MSKQAAIQYKAYKLLLESNELTSRQKQLLIEFNFFDKIKTLFGTVKNVGSTVVKAMKDEVYQDQLVASQKKIQDELADLKAIGAKVGKGDDFVNEFLMALLKDAGIDPAAIAAVKPASDAATPGTETGGPKPGTAVNPGNPEEAVPALVDAAAQITNVDTTKAVAAAAEKKVDAPKASQILAKALAQKTGAAADDVLKILNSLIKGGHLIAESRRLTPKDLIIAANEVKSYINQRVITERWLKIAGLLTEEPAKPAIVIPPAETEAAIKKFGKAYEDLRKEFTEEDISDDTIVAVLNTLDELDSIVIK